MCACRRASGSGAAHHGQVGQGLEVRVVGHILTPAGAAPAGHVRWRGRRTARRAGTAPRAAARALGVALHQAVALARVLPEALEGRLQVAVQHHRGVGAQVVEHRGGLVKEQRQVVLDAGGGHARAHVLVDAALGRVAFQQLAPAAAEAARASSSIGNSRPGSRRTSGTGYRLRWLSGSKVRMLSRSRRRTGPRGRAPASPWGTGRSARRAPRIRRGSPPGSHGCSRPA
jgi:hypothetical protein